ncbi:MAG: hypothetical protein SW019_03400 [Actinomycetota bacterium]|nr:hypothetical protein [Actinomycetota bacterium]
MPISTLHPTPTTTHADFQLARSHTWWDADAECTLVMSQPQLEPDLWLEYLRCAEHSYRKHGVQEALNMDDIRDGHDTTLFWSAIDTAGRTIGGVRAVGPLSSPEDSHAVVEWAGQPGLAAVRKMIDDRVPFGVLEMKTAFVTDDADRSKGVTRVLARTAFHAMALLDLQFCMATSAAHVLDKWRSSGGVVASIPATPYPDPRYRTKMMWWDRRNYIRHAEPDQVTKIINDIVAMERDWPAAHETAGVRENAL